MGAQRVLQAAAVLALAAQVVAAAPGQRHERVAVIDLGPPAADGNEVRRQLHAAIAAAGLAPVVGDGIEDALAGQGGDRDAIELAAAMAEAQRAFGALDCAAVLAAGQRAVGLLAARQAAGLPVPEQPRAWTYLLLCADRRGELDTAVVAAQRLRALGGSAEVPAELWRKYPEADAVIDREVFEVEITAEAPGATIWVDGKLAGTAPARVLLPAGHHVIAAAAGTRRGWAAGTAVRSQKQLAIPTPEQSGPAAEIAKRVASWNGQLPPPAELGWAMAQARARIALVRRGDRLEAWGRIGLAEAPHRLGGEDAPSTVAEAGDVLALVRDRVAAWTDRAPDPDRPLLVEDPREAGRDERKDPPTRWWVY
ncbi:MAG: hypothetical protein ACTHU0_31150, partial [Kofleriaceae bacterium]